MTSIQPVVFNVCLHSDGNAVRVHLSGELDRDTVPSLAGELGTLLDAGHREIVIDLGALSFVDVGGYRALRAFGEAFRESGVVVRWVRAGPSLRPLVRIFGPLPGSIAEGKAAGC